MKFKKPIVLDLKKNPSKVSFANARELTDWIQTELEVWNELLQKYPKQGQLRGQFQNVQVSPISSAKSNIEQTLNQIRNARGDESSPSPDEIERLAQTLAIFENNQVIHSKSQLGSLIMEIAEDDPEAALGAYGVERLIKLNNVQPIDFQAMLRGLRRLVDFDRRFTKSLSRSRSALDDTRAKFADELADFKSSSDLQKSKMDRRFGAMHRLYVAWATKFNDFLKGGQVELDRLLDTYREGLALRAPVQYWRDKKVSHAWWMGVSLFVFAGMIAGFGWVFINFGLAYLETHPDNDAHLIPRSWIVIAIPTIAAIWLLRIVSRLVTTNFALYADSKERVAMVSTYLALLEDSEKDAVSFEDRILVLQALFRPSSSDKVDEALPPSILEFLKRQSSSGS